MNKRAFRVSARQYLLFLRINNNILINEKMLQQRYLQNKAQTFLEYTTLIVIVSIVFATMQTMFRRAIQGTIKTVADQIGYQENAEQDFSNDGGGFTNAQISQTDSFSEKRQEAFAGNITYKEFEEVKMKSSASTDMGIH